MKDYIFPAKIYSRVLSTLLLKFTTQKYSTKKSCQLASSIQKQNGIQWIGFT